MSYSFYKILHLVGIMILFFSLGSMLAASFLKADIKGPLKKMIFISHGVSLALILVAGFGLMARLGIAQGGFPVWIWAKLAIWVFMGAAIALLKRKGTIGWPLAILMYGVGFTAAYLGVTHLQ